jgi:4-amino-4-deoxy-L-arabinose transferase-like glycosyltransferase
VTVRHQRGFAVGFAAILLLAALLRGLFPTADPPWRATVGVVWHDEGAWTHNARNKALWGVWQTDNWNPLYVAPVFTGLEYAAFRAFGVGLWQARLAPELLGVASVLLLGLGVSRVGGPQAGLAAALLLATNHVAVMYDRAAIMEGPMSALIVASWWAFARAQARPVWGLAAGAAAMLAYFTKAAAVFFVGALGLAAIASLVLAPLVAGGALTSDRIVLRRHRAAALWTLAGLTIAGLVALIAFVGPNWQDYRFYNWQMSVTRKPSYDLRSILNRVTWFPVLHDVLTRMWVVTALGLIGWLTRLVSFRRLAPAERLLVLWIGCGIAELLLHDVGNERRFVFLIPALVASAALTLARDRALVPAWLPAISRPRLLFAAPLVGYVFYILAGSFVRLASLYEVRPSVRMAAATAFAGLVTLVAAWPRGLGWIGRAWPPLGASVVAAVVAVGGVAQYVQWAAGRTYFHIEASRTLGRLLPPGTLVHGKLANGLALDNQIRPVFVGREFGNYADRLARNDVAFILTYVAPRTGYEGPVILDVIDAYPERRILWTFAVAETPGGRDRAALIEKGPPARPGVWSPQVWHPKARPPGSPGMAATAPGH